MLERLKCRLPDAENEEMLREMLAEAEEMICAYTRRDALPEELSGAAVQLAAVLYNRLGMEGESRHSEGGIDRSVDAMPGEIAAQIKPFRLAKVVRL